MLMWIWMLLMGRRLLKRIWKKILRPCQKTSTSIKKPKPAPKQKTPISPTTASTLQLTLPQLQPPLQHLPLQATPQPQFTLEPETHQIHPSRSNPTIPLIRCIPPHPPPQSTKNTKSPFRLHLPPQSLLPCMLLPVLRHIQELRFQRQFQLILFMNESGGERGLGARVGRGG